MKYNRFRKSVALFLAAVLFLFSDLQYLPHYFPEAMAESLEPGSGMDMSGCTDENLYETVRALYTVKNNVIPDKNLEVWTDGSADDFTGISFDAPEYENGFARIKMHAGMAGTSGKILKVRQVGFYGEEGFATVSDAAAATASDAVTATSSDADLCTFDLQTRVNEPAFILYYDNNAKDGEGHEDLTEWVVADREVTGLQAASGLKYTDPLVIDDLSLLYDAYEAYMNGNHADLEAMVTDDVTDYGGNRVGDVEIDPVNLTAFFSDTAAIEQQISSISKSVYSENTPEEATFASLTAAYRKQIGETEAKTDANAALQDVYNVYFSKFMKSGSGFMKKKRKVAVPLAKQWDSGEVTEKERTLVFTTASNFSLKYVKPASPADAKAEITEWKLISTYDGTEAFDADDAPGHDSSVSNHIVRSFDSVDYELGYTTAIKNLSPNDPAGYTGGYLCIEAVLPGCTKNEAVFDAESIAKWGTVTSMTEISGNVVAEIRYHLVNDDFIVAVPGAGTLSIPVLVHGAGNGKKITPAFKVWLEGNPVESRTVTADTFTVSAAPQMNVKLSLANSGKMWGAQTDSAGKALGNGVIQDYTVSLQVGTSTRLKGAEAPAGPVTFQLKLDGTHIKNSLTTTPLQKVAYITDSNTSGPAAVSYTDNGNGTVSVSVSNYSFPETALDDPLSTLISLKVGVFEEQTENMTYPEQYTIRITDTDLAASTASGNTLPAATPGTNDNQTDRSDDQVVTPYLNVRGRISWGTYFQTLANDGAFLENRLQKTSSAYQNTLATEAYPGQEVYAHTYIGYTQAQNISTAINAEDLLIKFDTGLLELPDTEQWTALAVGTNADISNGTAKLRYAARKDGSLWGSVTDMKNATLRELVYYDSLSDLQNAGKQCVGVLCEVRNVLLYGDSTKASAGIWFDYKLKVKETANPAADTTCVTESARLYSASAYLGGDVAQYVPDGNTGVETAAFQYNVAEVGIGQTADTDWHSENAYKIAWEPAHYNQDGSKNGGYQDTWSGASLWITPKGVKVNYQIETKNADGTVKTVYVPESGDDRVDFVLTPTVITDDGALKKIAYKFRIPDGMTLDAGSLVLGGTYDPAARKVTGGVSVPAGNLDSVQKTGYKLYTVTVDDPVSPFAVPALHLSATIDGSYTNGESFESRGQFNMGAADAATLDFQGYKTVSLSVIKIGLLRFTKNVTTNGVTDPVSTSGTSGASVSYRLTLRNDSDIALTEAKILDVFPYNGDNRGSSFTGAYRTGTVTLKGGNSAGRGVLYYTTSKAVRTGNYSAADADLSDGTWTVAAETASGSDAVFAIAEDATAVVYTGTIASRGAEYLLDIPFDTAGMYGTLGNDAQVGGTGAGYHAQNTNETTVKILKPKDVFTESGTESIDGKETAASDILRYEITYTNNTGADALVTITDKIPAYTAYVGNSAAYISGAGADAAPVEAPEDGKTGILTFHCGTVAPGAKAVVSFKVKVNGGAQEEVIENTADIKCGENTYTTNTTRNTVPKNPPAPSPDPGPNPSSSGSSGNTTGIHAVPVPSGTVTEPAAPEAEIIKQEEIPLGGLPKTGEKTAPVLLMVMTAAVMLAAVLLNGKKKKMDF